VAEAQAARRVPQSRPLPQLRPAAQRRQGRRHDVRDLCRPRAGTCARDRRTRLVTRDRSDADQALAAGRARALVRSTARQARTKLSQVRAVLCRAASGFLGAASGGESCRMNRLGPAIWSRVLTSSLLDRPSRARRVKGALRASHAMGVPPTLDPATAHKDMAPTRQPGDCQDARTRLPLAASPTRRQRSHRRERQSLWLF
jgi:hypothetical protein